jgi:hypothetical protein
MTKYALLLGYGIFNHSKVSKAKYADYVKSFARYVNQNKVDIVVISGGHTSPRRPMESEAESLAKYLKPRIGKNIKIVLENWSLTTLENIEFSKKFIELDNNTVTVFCDNIRPQKVTWFILHFWFGLSKDKIEKYFVDYSVGYYVKHFTDEGLGKEMSKGFVYKNVVIKPYRMRTDIDDAISALIGDILEIDSLYDKSLKARLAKYVKVKLHLIE